MIGAALGWQWAFGAAALGAAGAFLIILAAVRPSPPEAAAADTALELAPLALAASRLGLTERTRSQKWPSRQSKASSARSASACPGSFSRSPTTLASAPALALAELLLMLPPLPDPPLLALPPRRRFAPRPLRRGCRGA